MLDKLKKNEFKQGSKPTKAEVKASYDKARKELNEHIEENITELNLSDRMHQLILDMEDNKEILDVAGKIIENNKEMKDTLYKLQELKITELNLKEKLMYQYMDH